jgi:hypothetical protein
MDRHAGWPLPPPNRQGAPFRRDLLLLSRHIIPCYYETRNGRRRASGNNLTERGFSRVADTKKIEDKVERKKVKRTARKKAAPKAKRTTPRGSNKKKIKKLVRGVSKR